MINIILHIRKLPPTTWGGGILESKTQSAKICLNFNFRGGGILESKTQSAKICLNFNLGGGPLSGLKFQKGAFWRIWTEILLFEFSVQKPASASQSLTYYVCGD